MMNRVTLDPSALRSLFSGAVLVPGDTGYDKARTVFYGNVDKKPSAIVRAAGDADVQQAVRLARETGMEFAVRSGGHSTAGYGVTEGGLVLDVSGMKTISIDSRTKTCWADAGLTAAEYSKAAEAYKLATGFGDTGSVGISGITVGGGVGYLVRKYGLTIDDVLSFDIVTADGRLLRADQSHEPDLFWAVRGGGGNFGVVTRFQYRLHDMPSVVGGMLVLPATAETIAACMAKMESAPRELSAITNVMTAPPMPFLPKEVYGIPIIMAMMCFAGDEKDGAACIDGFRSIAKPYADMVHAAPYTSMYPPEQPGYHPMAANRTMFLDSVDELLAEKILSYLTKSMGTMAVCQLRVLGGAMADVDPKDTAFFHRKSEIMANLAALYTDRKDKPIHETWVDEFMHAIRQSDDGAYVNFLGDEGEARVRAAYPGDTWDRLVAVKSRYDPTNLFRLNQNIPPERR